MRNSYIVKPAYGATYETEDAVKAAWEANKDFLMVNEAQSYINKKSYFEHTPGIDGVVFLTGSGFMVLEQPVV